MKTKKSTKKPVRKTATKLANNAKLLLEGGVYIAEYDKRGKMVSKEEIDGKIVLELVLHVIQESVQEYKMRRESL